MSTKDNPGRYDCYGNAKPDEPMFVLLARDELAPSLVRAWAFARLGDVEGVLLAVGDVATKAKLKGFPNRDKIAEALTCADSMDTWLESRG